MSNFFGFHGEKGGNTGNTGDKVRRRKPMTNNASQGPAMLTNPLLKQNSNTMTYNGMYNVAAVAPPPINQRPARKTTSRSSQNAGMNFPPPNNPMYQQVMPITPVNHNPTVPTLTPTATTVSGNLTDLQAKVTQWKQRQKRNVSFNTVEQPPTGMFDVPPTQHDAIVDQRDEMDTEEHIDRSFATTNHLHLSASSNSGATSTSNLEQYKAELNRTVDSVRKEVSALRTEIANLSETVKLLNPSNQTNVLKMVEQQTQQITIDYNRLNGTMQEVQMITKAQQNQIDELAKLKSLLEEAADGRGVTAEELDDIVEGLSEEQKKSISDLEATVKSALQIISDRSHWIYGMVLQEQVSLYENHELGSRKKFEMPKGTKLQLTYPMKRTNEGTWMKARTVAEDGTLSVSWVPVWTFTPEVLRKFLGNQPPAEEEKIIYLGGFTLC